MSATLSRLAVLLFALVVAVAVAAPCHLLLQRLGVGGAAVDFLLAGSLVLLLGPPAVALVRGARAPGGGGGDASRRADVAAAERRIVELRGDPRRERWIPLVAAGHPVDDARIAAWNARIEQLEAVPHRRPYVAALLRGVEYSDEQIDYLEGRGRWVTCAHLLAVEQALQHGGLHPLPIGARRLAVGRRLRVEQLRERFAVPAHERPIAGSAAAATPGAVPSSLAHAVDALHAPIAPTAPTASTASTAAEDASRLRCEECDSEIRGDARGAPWPV